MTAVRWSIVLPWALTVGLFVTLLGAAVVVEREVGGGAALITFFAIIGSWGVANATVGAIIAARRPGNRIGRILQVGSPLLIGVFLGFLISAIRTVLTGTGDPLGAVAGWWAGITIFPAMLLAFPLVAILFPDGRLPGPRWWWPVAFVTLGQVALSGVFAISVGPVGEGLPDNPFGVLRLPPAGAAALSVVGTLLLVLSMGLAVTAIAVRWQRGDRLARTQLKWLLGASTVAAVLFPLGFIDADLVDILDVLWVASVLLVPIAIAVAVLRYHLYDIDRIISRTISYGVITALLVAVYGGLVLLLQAPLGAVTGGDTLAVAASTLVAAALFQPLRRRIQVAVDRRFDRARYDGERTAASFAAGLRDEVDPTHARSALLAAVDSALGPRGIAVWIRGETR